MRKAGQFICACAVAIALVWSWLWAFPFATALTRYCTRKAYRAETFVVTNAEYHAATRQRINSQYWLWGEVAERGERLVPTLRGGFLPRNREDLLSQFPKGMKIPVLYNPGAPEVTIQGETLRVISSRPKVWQEEAWNCWWLGRQVLIPVPLTLCIYFAVRANNRRYGRLLATRLAR